MDGFGTITWWGFTPALDLQDRDINSGMKELNLDKSNDDINIFLYGAGDCRHILKTVAKAYRHSRKKIHFYILENNLELYARDMLFLMLVYENPKRMGLQEKAEMFLELFGNSQVRAQAIEYVEKMSNDLIGYVTDLELLEQKFPLCNLSLLKFKERDMLEGIFKFWRKPMPDVTVFDIAKAWDLRIRQYLGVRYDSIPNVFDWDYQMKLAEKGAGIINNRHYNQWRHKGFAFEIREGAYERPNKTLASGMIFKHEGERLARRGYWGDIIVSPYVAVGIECEEKSFYKKANKLYVNNSQQIAEYNLLSFCHEIAMGTEYTPEKKEATPPEQKQTATLTEITEEEEGEEPADGANQEDTETAATETEVNPLDLPYEPLPCENIRVHFLPLQCSQELHKKAKYQKLFDIVYISNSLVHNLTEDLSKTFSDEASVILETSKFMLELKDEQHEEFIKKITQLAKAVGCQPVEECTMKDTFAKFVFNRKSS